MAKPITDEYRKMRIAFVEVLANYVQEYAQTHEPDYVAEQTKQVKRIAKFLGVAN